MTPFTVLLADDHTLVRAGIRSLIQEIEGARIVAEAADGRTAVELARELRPDLIVMDVTMGDMSGIEATAAICAERPGARVLVLSMHTSEDFVRRALAAGAGGYLVKDSAPVELRVAIEATLRGQVFVSPRVSAQLLSSLRGGQPDGNPLTERQREILRMIAEGKSTKEIAFRLGVSSKTVESHRAAIMTRLGIRDVAGLVIYAVRNKLVGLDRPGS
jgi:DNA-binding NarL/FixJ family response regulator